MELCLIFGLRPAFVSAVSTLIGDDLCTAYLFASIGQPPHPSPVLALRSETRVFPNGPSFNFGPISPKKPKPITWSKTSKPNISSSLSLIEEGKRRDLTNPFYYLCISVPLTDLYAQTPPTLIEDLFLKFIGLDFNYLEIPHNLEESSHQLEPSVAPCLKEASTAHGDHSFGYLKFPTGKACHPWSFALYSDYGQRLFPPFLLSSEMIYAPHISSPASDNRRTPLPSWLSEVKLGFSPMDLVSILGLSLQKSPSPLPGPKLLSLISPASLRVLWFASKILKNVDLFISNRFCRSMNCSIGLCLVNVDTSSRSSSSVLKYLNLTTVSLIQILGTALGNSSHSAKKHSIDSFFNVKMSIDYDYFNVLRFCRG
ncbi:unnamed protein product [Arabidopsis thaliana]|uniref:(thale cress) hypothetical protein n=1 Tax=Arabidopsis thaliana TaxID=3702 RepID=A0A7G2E7T0_ARATH|nr:unnamed protein product [Arabidopsis thaliana]